jgi:DUF917 family protein
MTTIYATDLEDLARGAAVLGTGGGGDPYVGKLMARTAIERHGPVELIDVDDLAYDGLVIPTAAMGAPTVLVEKLPNGGEASRAFQRLQDHLGQRATATMPIEAGGVNSMLPFTVAAHHRVPVVDADGMGRAFPELQMVTPTLDGISATPLALADEKGNCVLLEAIDNHWTERFARSVTIDMGCTAMLAQYPMTGKQAIASTIHGSLTLARAIGTTMRCARQAHDDVVAAVTDVTDGAVVFTGKIVDVFRRTERGFAQGTATLDGLDAHAGHRLEIAFQNEFLLARADGEVLVSVPDLITVLDLETGEPVTTEGMRYGFRVAVLGIPSPAQWRSEAGLRLVGPHYFGYDVDYEPVEQRAGATSRTFGSQG